MSKHAFIIDVTGREHLEKWQSIPGYEGFYEASNLGRLRSVDRIIIDRRNNRLFRGKVLKQRLGKHGYPVATLSKNGHAPECLVHRHVLAAFRGEPRNGQECCHINGIRTDNHIDNLRWDSRSGIMSNAWYHRQSHRNR